MQRGMTRWKGAMPPLIQLLNKWELTSVSYSSQIWLYMLL